MVWGGECGGQSWSAEGVTVGERPTTEVRVEAVVKLSAARRMLEVSGETNGDGGG